MLRDRSPRPMCCGCAARPRSSTRSRTRGRRKLWKYLHEEPFVNSLGALTGNQAMQQVKAGLKAIYLSGWQVAGDANLARSMYPDQSLYPANSVPSVVQRINNTLRRADELHHAEGDRQHRLVPAHRGRCRGWLRRCAECLRTDEGDDRSRRRRGALGRSALVGQEVRPHGRQGVDPHPGSDPESWFPRDSPRTSAAPRRW